MEVTFEGEHSTFTLCRLYSLNVAASLSLSKGLKLEAMGAIWTTSLELDLGFITLGADAHAGGVGAKCNISSDEISIGAAAVFGADFTISWD